MAPVVKLYLREHMEDRTVKEILRYAEKRGHRGPTLERFRRGLILYVYDWRDFALLKKRFAGFIDAWADLRI